MLIALPGMPQGQLRVAQLLLGADENDDFDLLVPNHSPDVVLILWKRCFSNQGVGKLGHIGRDPTTVDIVVSSRLELYAIVVKRDCRLLPVFGGAAAGCSVRSVFISELIRWKGAALNGGNH